MKSILEGHKALAEEIDKAAEIAGYLWERNWAERNGGNLTINVTEFVDEGLKALPAITAPFEIGAEVPALKGCWFYCKGTNRYMRGLAKSPMENGSIIRICDDCKSYEIVADAPVRPTSELPSHLLIHNYLVASGSSYKATLHTHPIELVALSHSRQFADSKVLTNTLWSMIPETLAFAPLGIGFVPYAMPSTVDLANDTLEQIKNYDVVLWEKHGTFAVGTDIIDAFDQTDVLNKAACIYMTAKNMGFTPDGMTLEQMMDIRTTFNLPDKRVR